MSERAGNDPPGIVGISWLLASVETRGQRYPVPVEHGAWVRFEADEEFVAWDGVNTLSGQWRLDGARLWVDGLTTLVGYGGDDPATVAVLQSFGHVLLADPDEQDLRVERSGGSLVLRDADHRLKFTARPAEASA